MVTYFNHYTCVAQNRWQRRAFLSGWWRIYADDPRWAPPYFPTLRRELEPEHNPHLARMNPVFIHNQALPKRRSSTRRDAEWTASTGNPFSERTVAATVALCDPRQGNRTVYLGLLRCVNHAESLEHLLDGLSEHLWANGCRRVVGPTGLSPHLETGLLEDHWNQTPPLHTAYNPPYMPEVVSSLFEPVSIGRLYHMPVSLHIPAAYSTQAQILPFGLARLATDLLPLLQVACSPWTDFAAPDADEASFLLRWLGRWPLFAWLAEVDDKPAGFVLLQPDVSPLLRRSNGGRHPLWRLWLAWRVQRPVRQGRVVFGGVLPQYQGQGVGRELWHQVLVTAHLQGWKTLSIGPLPDTSPACAFLEGQGALPRQTYRLYQRTL
jgi:GNAT superfamily N-acetyltransferase